jgi:AcrR family transcriptional regulator
MARPRSEEARQSVLTSALEVIAEVGVGGFTIDAVAKHSGVAKTTIYRHWDSGNHLLLDAVDTAIEPFPTPNTGSLRSDLIELYGYFLPVMEDPRVFRMMLGMIARSAQDESFRALKAEFMQERHHPLKTIIQLAQSRGEINDDLDLDFALDIIEGPFASKRLMRGEHIAVDQLPKYVDAALYGLCGHPSPAVTSPSKAEES